MTVAEFYDRVRAVVSGYHACAVLHRDPSKALTGMKDLILATPDPCPDTWAVVDAQSKILHCNTKPAAEQWARDRIQEHQFGSEEIPELGLVAMVRLDSTVTKIS